MAFPSSPTNGQLYTNALGTQYRYYLADTAWKIVGGPTTNGSVGPGTVGTLAMFTPDTTSVGDSFLVQGSGIMTYNTKTVGSTNTSFHQIRSDTSYGTCGVQCITQGDYVTDMSLDLLAYGGKYDPGSTSGPDGTTLDNGTTIMATGADWMDLSVGQGRANAKGHLTFASSGYHASKLTWDSTGVGIGTTNPTGVLHVSADTSPVAGGAPGSSPEGQGGINCNVGPVTDYCTKDTTTGMVEYRDTVKATTAGDPVFNFFFPGLYESLIGWFDLSIYDTGTGENRYGHFSLRTSNFGAHSITKDYGDSTLIHLADSGDGARLLISNTGAPNWSPVLQIKTSNPNYATTPYELDYHIFLRKIV